MRAHSRAVRTLALPTRASSPICRNGTIRSRRINLPTASALGLKSWKSLRFLTGQRSCSSEDRGRPRLTLSVTYAPCDPSRLTVAHPASRKPLEPTQRWSPALRARLEATRRCPRGWSCPRCQQPQSLSRSLAGYVSPPSVQLTPTALFHLALSRPSVSPTCAGSCSLYTRSRPSRAAARCAQK